ncbi:putative serine esterase-domain-containing protein [Glomus cerebriforme]|uniref:Putative serine esterase-domain-containing protein n=1 Tax=Glomus cerebriforme TaxID=658196 RepID=A0A397TBB3_9GLOM|nr:putative serine esterase-domain-containing protein [Glomus cerebriforme]
MSQTLVKIWESSSELSIGEISRYRIKFDQSINNSLSPVQNLILKITNKTPVAYRGAVLSGPYNFSASVIPTDHIKQQQILGAIPKYKSSISSGESWKSTLKIPSNGIGDWTIEIISEILFSTVKVNYKIKLFAVFPKKVNEKDPYSSLITYEFYKTVDIFRLPELSNLDSENDIHLVVLTHGFHGSVLDNLYLREAIQERYSNNNKIIVYAPDVNHSLTGEGIEKCSKRLAEHLLKYVGWNKSDIPFISRISMIGHSLGGIFNLFVVGYLQSITNGTFFEKIEPIHFITIASPLLGSTQLAWYITFPMKLGMLGKTGKELVLKKRTADQEPLLLSLSHPTSSSHIALKKFRNRTLYANIVNDTIVFLKTSSLYFVDLNEDDMINVGLLKSLKFALATFNPPKITEDYLTRSFSGISPIIHDKVYTPEDIPVSSQNNISIEEKMARNWHEDMTWRKVLVRIEGIAHVDVIVRRKWLNAAGTQVIEHLLDNHELL